MKNIPSEDSHLKNSKEQQQLATKLEELKISALDRCKRCQYLKFAPTLYYFLLTETAGLISRTETTVHSAANNQNITVHRNL